MTEQDKMEKILSVADILTQDDVREVLNGLIAEKRHITEIICIYCCDDGGMFFRTNNVPESHLIYMLEKTKYGLLEHDLLEEE